MQLHNTNNFIVKTWLVFSLTRIVQFYYILCHGTANKWLCTEFLFWGDDGKQATLNSSNYMRSIRNSREDSSGLQSALVVHRNHVSCISERQHFASHRKRDLLFSSCLLHSSFNSINKHQCRCTIVQHLFLGDWKFRSFIYV